MSGSVFTRRYGASPLHLLAHLAAFAICAYALAQIIDGGTVVNFVVWFGGAALLHDLVFLPLYSILDRVAHGWARRAHGRRRGRLRHPDVPVINHVRAPALISGLLLIVYFPLILGAAPDEYLRATGHHLHGYARNWILVSAVLFAGSALLYAVRAARAEPARMSSAVASRRRPARRPRPGAGAIEPIARLAAARRDGRDRRGRRRRTLDQGDRRQPRHAAAPVSYGLGGRRSTHSCVVSLTVLAAGVLGTPALVDRARSRLGVRRRPVRAHARASGCRSTSRAPAPAAGGRCSRPAATGRLREASSTCCRCRCCRGEPGTTSVTSASLFPYLTTHVKGNPPGPLIALHLLGIDTPAGARRSVHRAGGAQRTARLRPRAHARRRAARTARGRADRVLARDAAVRRDLSGLRVRDAWACSARACSRVVEPARSLREALRSRLRRSSRGCCSRSEPGRRSSPSRGTAGAARQRSAWASASRWSPSTRVLAVAYGYRPVRRAARDGARVPPRRCRSPGRTRSGSSARPPRGPSRSACRSRGWRCALLSRGGCGGGGDLRARAASRRCSGSPRPRPSGSGCRSCRSRASPPRPRSDRVRLRPLLVGLAAQAMLFELLFFTVW